MNPRRVVVSVAALLLVVLANPAAAQADPVRDLQWHLDFLNVDQAHKITRGAGVVVAVIDSGVDASHPDLQGTVLPGMDLLADGDGKGWTDEAGHGTAMAGLIAAHGRALGIAPDAKILPVRVETERFSVIQQQYTRSFQVAIDNHAEVICLAVSAPFPSADQERAIQRALAADIVVVAASGNRPEASFVEYPAAYPGVVAAAGVDRQGKHAEVSVTGWQVTLAAPAVDIVSTDSQIIGDSGYLKGTGTSSATAIIAGAAALVRARYPDLSADEVVHRLTTTADDKGRPGRDDEYGYGIVNLVAALTADVPPPSRTTAPPSEFLPNPPPPPAADPIKQPDPPIAPYVAAAAVIAMILILTVLARRSRRTS